MMRTFLTLALSLFLLAEASAQTTPAAAKKTTARSAKASARTAARKAKKARRVALKTTPSAPLANDGWPAIDDSKTAVAAVDNVGFEMSGAPAASSRGELENENISAAPGMPIHMRTSNGLVPYSVRPARKSAAAQTTLGN